MGSQKSDSRGLREFITKKLHQDFEDSGETREDFDLFALVSSDVITYGSPGSETRRFVQRRWHHIKNKSIKAFQLYLKKKIIPSTVTQAKLLRDSQPPRDSSTEMTDKEEKWSEEESHL